MKLHWIIEGISHGPAKALCWSKIDGWVDRELATIFTQEEKDSSNLPIAGIWKREEGQDALRDATYIGCRGLKCLFCLSCNINAGPYQGDGNVVWCDITCDDCDNVWEDMYTLTGVNVP